MLDQANFSMIQSQSRMEQQQKDMETLLSTFTENIESQQDQNFSQDDNVVPKNKMKRRKYYSNTKLKTRNFLANVSYRRFKQSDLNKSGFIIDILSFLLQNFNPINLDRKLDTEKERHTVNFLWDECIPHEFVSCIYKQHNFTQLSRPNLTFQKAKNILKEYLVEDNNRINRLKYKIEEKFELIQYVYSLLFSKNYNRTNNFGIQKKSNFDFNFATWKNKKSLTQNVKQTIQMQVQITAEGFSTAKNPANYRSRETEMNEQVPIDIRITDDIMALEEQQNQQWFLLMKI